MDRKTRVIYGIIAAVSISVLVIVLTVIRSGGIRYRSSFTATMMVTTNTSKTMKLSFSTFRGTKVGTLRNKSDAEVQLRFKGKLESGTLSVYYDCDGSKKKLFDLHAGEQVDSVGARIPKGKVTIIVETDGKCEEGKIEVSIE